MVLSSNTSSISITRLAAVTSRPEKFIGMHFMNPVPMMKLVEVIRGLATSEDTFQLTVDLANKMGKIPVEANDYPGFIANRILLPMINEAVYCLYEGVGTAEAIDEVMKLGMNHPMGPLALADLIGLDTCLAIMNVLHDGLGDTKYRPCPLLRKYVDARLVGPESRTRILRVSIMSRIAIVDYRAGNLTSVERAVRFLGYDAVVTSNGDEILGCRAGHISGGGRGRVGHDRFEAPGTGCCASGGQGSGYAPDGHLPGHTDYS